MQKNAVNKTGFTLIELLIVVLIIGILSATGLPMYRKAVEKSKVADALNTMQAVAKSEHGWYLTNNNYTKDFANLDIVLIDVDGERAEGESYDTVNYTFTLQDNAIKAERTNNEYTLYKMYEDPNIYCLPQDHYICEQFDWGINKNLCDNIGSFWADKTTTCYNTEEERCTGVNMPWAEGRFGNKNYHFCGYYNTDEVEINGFGVCSAAGDGGHCLNSTFTGAGVSCSSLKDNNGNLIYNSNGACQYSEFNDGAICDAQGSYACDYSEFNNHSTCYSIKDYVCNNSTFTAGSKCIVDINNPILYGACKGSVFTTNSECISAENSNGYGGCEGNTFTTGSKCIANAKWSCRRNTFEPGSCCEGKYCPGGTPKCECPKNADGSYPTSC